jgi:hypothetical protein
MKKRSSEEAWVWDWMTGDPEAAVAVDPHLA